MNDSIDNLIGRLRKIAGFPQRSTYYSVAVTPDEALALLDLIAPPEKKSE